MIGTQKRRRLRETETLILKPEAGSTYVEVIRTMKKEVEVGPVTINGIVKTNAGKIAIKIKGSNATERQAIRNRLSEKMREVATVVERPGKSAVQIMNIDETVEDPEEVIDRAEGCNKARKSEREWSEAGICNATARGGREPN